MSAEELRQQQLIQLKEILTSWFSRDELEDLSFDLGVDYRALGGSTKEGNVRNLIMELSRRGRLPKLLERCDQKKPEIEWDIFSYLYQAAPIIEPSSIPAQEYDGGNRLLLSLLGVLAVVILATAGASTYFLTRTTNPQPTARPPIVHIPIKDTPFAQQEIINLPTPTNIVMTAIPSVNSEVQNSTPTPAESPTATQFPIVETATLPSDVISQTAPPFSVKITNTYQGDPLREANIRSGPGLEYEIVAKRGPNLEIVAWAYAYNSTGIPWYLIDIGGGQFGWISGVLVEIDPIPFENFPVAATVPPTNTPTPTSTPTETPIPTFTPTQLPEDTSGT